MHEIFEHTADNRILKSMRKQTAVEQMERTLTTVYQAGISLWGINHQTADLFQPDNLLQDDRLFVGDISVMKQKMLLCGKRIFSPAILHEHQIDMVIVAIPTFFREIEGCMKAIPGRCAKIVLGISQLIFPRYTEDGGNP